MTRPAARITHTEAVRLIKAVQACGLPIARITFDGAKVDVVVGGNEEPASARASDPANFQSLEEYEAWRAENGIGCD